jgi:Camelysin metallo-endopeptidase
MIDTPRTFRAGDPTPASAQPRRRRRGVLALLLGLTTISLGAGMFSLAIFTDSSASTGTFATGTIDITSSPSVAFSVSGMVPGDTTTQALTIANAGTASMRYAMTAEAPDTLGGTLTLEVRTQGTDCATFDGASVLAATVLDGASFGSPNQGPDTGDRTLAAAASEVLCFRVHLPIGADDSVQGATSDATFTFDAEQTANNP